MNISEKELEDFIFNNLNEKKHEYLSKIGFSVNALDHYNYFRQVNLGSYGIADIIGLKVYKEKNSINLNYATAIIFELKECKIDYSTITQILRYKGGVLSSCCGYDLIDVNLVVIGSSIDDKLKKDVELMSPDIQWLTYNLSLNGLTFNNNCIDPSTIDDYDIPEAGNRVKNILNDLKLISENENDFINT